MILNHLSPTILSFLSEIEGQGFRLCLVGGITRDYLLNGTLGSDFDFEIRASKEISRESWPDYYKNLHHFFKTKKIQYTELSYLITRIEYEGVFLEFASPRTEINLEDKIGHHHFSANLDSHLTYLESFKRRDFTINAIGIELDLLSKSEKLIDPYHGADDLRTGTIRAISDDFFHDSVRFLRLIRFSLKFNKMKIDESLLSGLAHFNLKGLSQFHFGQELFKSEVGAFLNLFVKLVKEHALEVPDKFKFWTNYTFPTYLKSKEGILGFIFFQNEADARNVLTFFSMPEKKLRDLRSLKASLDHVKSITLEEQKKIFSLPIEEALEHELFKDYKNIKEKKEWLGVLSDEKKSNHLVLSRDELSSEELMKAPLNLHLPSQLRSYWPYYIALKNKLGL